MRIIFLVLIHFVAVFHGLKYCKFNIILQEIIVNELDKVKNCEVLDGHLVITSLTPYDCGSVHFPVLTEVKKFIIVVFNNCQRKDLRAIFPKLVIIRGQQLFKIYSLIIYSNEWPGLYFPNLRVVESGEVLISRNRYSCNYRTINWDAVTGVYDNKPHEEHRINLQIPEICPEYCHSRCNGRCWSFDVCQTECSNHCLKQGLYCSMTNSSLCCHKECLGGCYNANSTSIMTVPPSNKQCVSCRRVIWKQACVRKCPSGYVETQTNVCIRKSICSSKNMYINTIKNQCVRICPRNLVRINGRYKYCMAKLSANEIKHCGVILILKEKEIDSVKGCYSAKHIIIRLSGNYPDHDKLLRKLKIAFSKLRVIHNFLQIVKSSLKSLDFLSNLREISGRKSIFYLNGVTMDITGNNDLTDLWIPAPNSTFLIRHGKPRILANRMLCPIKIKTLLYSLNSNDSINSQNNWNWSIINTTNGQLAICNVVPIVVTKVYNITSTTASFRLKVNKVNAGVANQSNPVILSSKLFIQSTLNNRNGRCSKHRWKSRNGNVLCYSSSNKSSIMLLPLSIWPQPQTEHSYFVCDIDNLEPATSYCAFFQYRFVSIHTAAQSSILTFKTNRERLKSNIRSFKIVHLNYSSISLSWQPPLLYNSKYKLESNSFRTDHIFYLLSVTTNKQLQYYTESKVTNQNEPGLCLSDYTNKIKSLRLKLKAQQQKDLLRLGSDEENRTGMEIQPNVSTRSYDNVKDKRCQSYCIKKCGKASMYGNNNLAEMNNNGVENFLNKGFRNKYQKMNSFDQDAFKLLANRNSSQLTKLSNQFDSSDSLMILATNNVNISNLDYFRDYIVNIRACVQTSRNNNRVDSLLCSWGSTLNFRTNSNPNADMIGLITKLNATNSIIQLESNENKEYLTVSWEPSIRSNGEILMYSIRTRSSNKQAPTNNSNYKWSYCYVLPHIYSPNTNDSNITASSLSSHRVRHYTKLSVSSLGASIIDIQIIPITFSNNKTAWSNIIRLKIGNYLTIKDNALQLKNFIGKIIGCIVTVLVFLLVAVILAVFYGRHKYLKAQAALSKVSYLYQPTPDVWSIDLDDLRLTDPIGKGSFGLVYSGYLSQITTPYKDVCSEEERQSSAVKVAVKTLTQKAATVDDVVEFLAEASIMKQLVYSSHLVRLVGVYSGHSMTDSGLENSGSSLPMIIMEWMPLGDLAHYLSTSAVNGGANEPAGKQAIEWAAEIADGMAFLADRKLVHRDLAGRNCLLSEKLSVKVADFGFTRPMNDEYYYRKKGQARMPVRWMAPESLRRALFTLKTDVWSYGIVLYEIATLGSLPYTGMNHEQVIDFVINRGRLDIDQLKFPSCLLDMIVWCLSYLENERPTFSEILDFLMPYLHNYYESIGKSESFNVRFESEYFYHQIISNLDDNDIDDDAAAGESSHIDEDHDISYKCSTEIV